METLPFRHRHRVAPTELPDSRLWRRRLGTPDPRNRGRPSIGTSLRKCTLLMRQGAHGSSGALSTELRVRVCRGRGALAHITARCRQESPVPAVLTTSLVADHAHVSCSVRPRLYCSLPDSPFDTSVRPRLLTLLRMRK